VAVAADVSDEASTALMAASALEAFGTIDVLVNSAAIYAGLERRPFDQIEVADWDRVMAVNLRGPWLSAKACAAALRDGGGAIKRALEPQDIVGTAVFLASEASAMITGQTIVVDGGRQFL
jgi:NAD(P)-dependent dehydrogenase (short-subunit alcohol dehydrogenase family)